MTRSEVRREKTQVYPVGLLHDWKLRKHRPLRKAFRYPWVQFKARNWRAVRNYFRNGWLTEHAHPCAHDCGWGWTKRASWRRANRAHLDYKLWLEDLK